MPIAALLGHRHAVLLSAVALAGAFALSPLIEAAEQLTSEALRPSEDLKVAAVPIPPVAARPTFDSGLSGALSAAICLPGEATAWSASAPPQGWSWQPVDATEGTTEVAVRWQAASQHLLAPDTPGAYRLSTPEVSAPDGPVLLVMVPFSQKSRGRVDSYALGSWPGEGGGASPYPLPQGFVRMSEALAQVPLSPRLKLGNFKTKNQQSVWPKYLVLDMQLIDKLELIAEDLRGQGLPGNQLYVMSGFRTPAYNAPGVGAGGRAQYSRHQFGDAADVWVDDNADGRMDDLNGDGRSDTGDARVMLAAQERVEAAHPELVGGGGVYKATSAHGPFLHVDVRGSTARWGHL